MEEHSQENYNPDNGQQETHDLEQSRPLEAKSGLDFNDIENHEGQESVNQRENNISGVEGNNFEKLPENHQSQEENVENSHNENNVPNEHNHNNGETNKENNQQTQNYESQEQNNNNEGNEQNSNVLHNNEEVEQHENDHQNNNNVKNNEDNIEKQLSNQESNEPQHNESYEPQYQESNEQIHVHNEVEHHENNNSHENYSEQPYQESNEPQHHQESHEPQHQESHEPQHQENNEQPEENLHHEESPPKENPELIQENIEELHFTNQEHKELLKGHHPHEEQKENAQEPNINNEVELNNNENNLENQDSKNNSINQQKDIINEQSINQSNSEEYFKHEHSILNPLTPTNQEPAQSQSPKEKTISEEQKQDSTQIFTNEKRLQKAIDLKEEARKFVEEKNFDQAIKIYEEALMVCHPSYFGKSDPKLVKEMVNLTNMLLNNLSLCYYNIKVFQRSLNFAEQVLLTDPKNVKSHFRKALCYKNLNDIERSFNSIKEAKKICLESNQNNASIFQEFDSIKTSYQDYLNQNKEKEKELYSKMMQSTKKEEKIKTTSPPSPKPEKKNNDEELETNDGNWPLIVLPTTLLNIFLVHYVFKLRVNEGKNLLMAGLLSGTMSGVFLSKKRWLKVLFAMVSIGFPIYLYRKIKC